MNSSESSRLLAHQLTAHDLHPPRKIGDVEFVSGIACLVCERKQPTDVLSVAAQARVAAKTSVDIGCRDLFRRHPPASGQGLLQGGACRTKKLRGVAGASGRLQLGKHPLRGFRCTAIAL